MVNRYRANWSNMGASKYEFEPDKLDKDIKTHQARYESKKQLIKDVFEGLIKSDPVRQEETFQMFVEVLREWREEHE